jgi:hypothetical protein
MPGELSEFIVTLGASPFPISTPNSGTSRWFVRVNEIETQRDNANKVAGNAAREAEEIRSAPTRVPTLNYWAELGEYTEAAYRKPDYETLGTKVWFIDRNSMSEGPYDWRRVPDGSKRGK